MTKEKKYQDYKKRQWYELLNYNKKHHIELLELLSEQSEEVKSKLRTYSIVLIDQLNWEISEQYTELLDKYIGGEIDSSKFRIRFSERYESIQKVADVLKSNRVLLTPDKNSLSFGDLLAEIDNCCKAYSDDPEPYRQKWDLGEVEFRISIQKIYLKIQDFLSKE